MPERRRSSDFGWDHKRWSNRYQSSAGFYGFKEKPYQHPQQTSYGYSGYHGYKKLDLSEGMEIFIVGAVGFTMGLPATGPNNWEGSRYNTYCATATRDDPRPKCMAWVLPDRAHMEEIYCAMCNAVDRECTAVQHTPAGPLNRDDIFESGFYPSDYDEYSIEIKSVECAAWTTTVCPRWSHAPATSQNMDLYVSLTKVAALNDRPDDRPNVDLVAASGGSLGMASLAEVSFGMEAGGMLRIVTMIVGGLMCCAACSWFLFATSSKDKVEQGSLEMATRTPAEPPTQPVQHCSSPRDLPDMLDQA